jgi:dolichol-phosphate mannosyltransferase
VAEVISIIVPTYNERENLKPLLDLMSKALEDYEYEVVIVDDSSPDGTAKLAEELAKKYPIKVLKRENKQGLASAIVYGFQNARGDVLGVIDADLQHPPEYMKEFIKAIEEDGYDIALGSRYVEGGRIEGWSKKRILVSKGAITLAKPLIWRVKDPISGYFFLRKSVVKGVEFNPTGFKLSLEILVKGKYRKVKEIPYTFKERRAGKSKLGKGEILKYLELIRSLYLYKLKNFKTALFGGSKL